MFAVKLAKFLMFTVPGENAVKCLEDFSFLFCLEIFQISTRKSSVVAWTSSIVFGCLRQSLEFFGSVRNSEITGNYRQMAKRCLLFTHTTIPDMPQIFLFMPTRYEVKLWQTHFYVCQGKEKRFLC